MADPSDVPPLFHNNPVVSTNGSVNLAYDGDVGIIVDPKEDAKSALLTFHNISYTVKVKKETKVILDNVSGIFNGGVNGILGPTGSGKSSLLDVLAGRKDPKHLSGHVLLNGTALPPDFRLMAGYVVQDDVVMGTLTIRENFAFSAALRLPQSLSREERKRRVNLVIEELQLEKCADSRVGTEFTRGVSGGERKRCNIGMELITSPKILFLDEPTSGLDANTAGHVMQLLQMLSKRGRTIIFSIHQPRFTIYRTFDSLVLLTGGKLAYQGPTSEALPYFKSIGYTIDPYNNPADYFLDLLMGEEKRDPSAGPADEPLPELFEKSEMKRLASSKLDPLLSEYEREGRRTNSTVLKYKTSFGRQIWVVCGRTVKNLVRNPKTSVLQVAIMIVFGALVGAIYFKVDKSTAGLQNRVGAFFFIVMNLVFGKLFYTAVVTSASGNLDAVELFIKERHIFVHENASGYYRVSSYFLAKVFCDILPRRTIPTLLFCTIAYFMIGLQLDVAKFFIFCLAMVLVSYSGASLAFFFSATVNVFAIANLSIALCYVFMMLFSGFMVNIGSVLNWLQWIKWVSIFRYAMNAASINELKGMRFYDYNGTWNDAGDFYLTQQGIPYGNDWDLWSQFIALGSMTLILLCLAYIQLVRIKKLK